MIQRYHLWLHIIKFDLPTTCNIKKEQKLGSCSTSCVIIILTMKKIEHWVAMFNSILWYKYRYNCIIFVVLHKYCHKSMWFIINKIHYKLLWRKHMYISMSWGTNCNKDSCWFYQANLFVYEPFNVVQYVCIFSLSRWLFNKLMNRLQSMFHLNGL